MSIQKDRAWVASAILEYPITDRNYRRYKGVFEKHYFNAFLKGDFETLLYLFGIDFLTAINAKFEYDENYEQCAKIKAVVDLHNLRVGDKLTTKINP